MPVPEEGHVRLNDAITGLLLLLFSLSVFLYSASFPKLSGSQFSAGFWPQTLSLLLGLCSLALIVNGLRARSGGEYWLRLDAWWKQPGTLLTVLLVPGAVIFYILASDFLGFIVCSLIILFVLAYRFGLSPLRAAVLSLLTTAGMHLLFVELLLVSLPWGILRTVVFSG